MKSWLLLCTLLTFFISAADAGQNPGPPVKKQTGKYKNNYTSGKTSKEDTIKVYQPLIRVYFGGFRAYSKSSFTINSEKYGNGTDINPAKTFGHHDKKIIPRFELILNPYKAHELDFTYWSIHRSRTDSLNQYVQYGDTMFYPKTIVTSTFNFSNYGLSYRYSFINDAKFKAGLSFGGRLFKANNSITTHQNGHSYSEENTQYAPVPLVGIHTTINAGNHFVVRASAEYLRLNRINWYFQSIDARAGIEYYPVKHIGIGADFHYLNTDIQRVPSKKLNGEMEYTFNAFSLYLGIRI